MNKIPIIVEIIGILIVSTGIGIEATMGGHVGFIIITVGSVIVATGSLLYAKVYHLGKLSVGKKNK